MSPYDFPGLVSGLIGFQLVLWGSVLAVLSGFRALLVRGQPGRGRVARGLLAGSAIVIAGGAAVLGLAELTDRQRALDTGGAPLVAGLALSLAAVLAIRIARRKPAPVPPAPDERPPTAA